MDTRENELSMKAITAAKRGHHIHLEKLIREGVDVNAHNAKGYTALMAAAQRNKVNCLELLLKDGAKVNCVNRKMETALSIAAKNGFSECSELLIQAGAKVNQQDFYGATALMSAAENGHTEVVSLFLQSRADVNLGDWANRSALGSAALNGHVTVVKLLIEAGADVNSKNTIDGYNSLLQSALICNAECMEMLIRAGADVNKTEKHDGFTPLYLIAGHDKDADLDAVITCMNLLIGAGADIEKANNQGVTPLMAASRWKNIECVDILIQSGVDVNFCPENNETALMKAVQCFRYQRYPPGNNNTPLSRVNLPKVTNSYKCTTLLLEAGADVNKVSRFGNSTLMTAVENNNYECVKLLLRSGAHVNLRNACQMKAIDHIHPSSDHYEQSKIQILLYAAGEVSTAVTNVLPSITDNLDISLQNLCREAIRKHLLHLDPHSHLFSRVNHLEVPILLKDYLLYSQSIEPGRAYS